MRFFFSRLNEKTGSPENAVARAFLVTDFYRPLVSGGRLSGSDPLEGLGAEEYSQTSTGIGADANAVCTVAGSGGKPDELDPCPEGQAPGGPP